MPDQTRIGRAAGLVRNWKIALALGVSLGATAGFVIYATTSSHCNLEIGGEHGWVKLDCPSK